MKDPKSATPHDRPDPAIETTAPCPVGCAGDSPPESCGTCRGTGVVTVERSEAPSSGSCAHGFPFGGTGCEVCDRPPERRAGDEEAARHNAIQEHFGDVANGRDGDSSVEDVDWPPFLRLAAGEFQYLAKSDYGTTAVRQLFANYAMRCNVLAKELEQSARSEATECFHDAEFVCSRGPNCDTVKSAPSPVRSPAATEDAPSIRDPHHNGSTEWKLEGGHYFHRVVGTQGWVQVEQIHPTPARIAALHALSVLDTRRSPSVSDEDKVRAVQVFYDTGPSMTQNPPMTERMGRVLEDFASRLRSEGTNG